MEVEELTRDGVDEERREETPERLIFNFNHHVVGRRVGSSKGCRRVQRRRRASAV